MPQTKDPVTASQDFMSEWVRTTTELTEAALRTAANAQLDALNRLMGAVGDTGAAAEPAIRMAKRFAKDQFRVAKEMPQAITESMEPEKKRSGWGIAAMIILPTLVAAVPASMMLIRGRRAAEAKRLARARSEARAKYKTL